MDEMREKGVTSAENQETMEEAGNGIDESQKMEEPQAQPIAGAEAPAAPLEHKYCVKCGSEILPGQEYCSKCGQKVGARIDESKPGKSGNKKLPIIAGAVAAAVVVIVVVALLIRGVQAKNVTLNKDSLTIKAGESAELSYIINPENTKNKTVSWSSSNDSIAVVNDGKITAKNEGDCTITITTKNGKTDTCNIIVEAAGPDLVAIYNKFCNSSYSEIASDGSYLTIDTNPDDKSDYIEAEAILAIIEVNEELGLPESVNNKMDSTRALDGMQTYEGDGIEVSWTYHPDNGLEIMYSLIK